MKFKGSLWMMAAGWCGLAVFNAHADANWRSEVTDDYYSVPANWSTGALPENAEVGTFSGNQDYIIRFPAGGFTENGVTRVNGPAEGRSLVFDTTGTWWLKSGPDKWPEAWTSFQICNPGGDHYFNIEDVNATGNANDTPVMCFSNALFRIDYSTSGTFNTLSQGLLNLYNPGGVNRPQHSLVLGAARIPTTFVIKPDSTFIGNRVRLRGSEHGYRMLVEGGSHEIWNGLLITEPGNIGQANVSNTVQVSGGSLAVRGGSVIVGQKNDPNNFAELLVDNDGAMSIAESLYVSDRSNTVGTVTLRDDARFYSRDAVVGSSDYAAASLSLTDNAVMTVGNTFVVERNSWTDATADIAGQSTLAVSNILEIGRGNTGFGTVTLRDDARAFVNDLRIGTGGGSHGTLRVQDNALITLATANADIGQHADGTGRLEVVSGHIAATNAALYVGGLSGSAVFSGGRTDWRIIKVEPDADATTNTLLITGGEHRAWSDANNTVSLDLGNNLRAGVVDIQGGTLQVTRMVRIGLYDSGPDLTSTLRVSGGLLRVTPNPGGENVINVADSDNSRGRAELLGGVIETETLRGWAGSLNKGGTGHSSLFADGGTLRAFNIAGTNPFTFLETFDTAELGPAGITLDSAGYDVTVNQTFTDAPDADGLFLKTGTGTLTANRGSTHARTAVAQGTLAITNAIGSFGRDLTVTNGATLALTETAGALTCESLTLGTSDTPAFLSLTHANTLTVTDTLTHLNAYLIFSAPADTTYTLLRVNGTLPAGTLDGLTLLNPNVGKDYTFALVPDGTDTLIQITVGNLAISELTWDGSHGTAWHTPENWTPEQIPAVGTRAVFPANAAEHTVNIATPAVATVLAFDSATSYTLQGAPLSISAGSVNNALGTHTLSAPLNLLGTVAFPTAADAATLLTGTLSAWPGSTVAKSGPGTLAIGGNNAAAFSGAWKTSGGRLRFDAPDAFGAASTERRSIEVTGGTLTYAGSAPATVERGITLNTGSETAAAIIETAADLSLTGAFNLESGIFCKTGPGTLMLDAADRTIAVSVGNGAGDVNTNPTGPVTLPASGDAPASAAGLAGFNVLDGTLRITGSGPANSIVNQRHFGFIGAGLLNGLADPTLELNNVRFAQGGGGLHFIIGNSIQPEATARTSTLRLINGARFETDTLKLGYNGIAPASFPTLIMSNSTFASTYLLLFGANEHTHPTARIAQGSTALSSGGGQWGGGLNLGRNVDIIVSEGSVLGQTNPDGGGFRFSDNNSSGTLRFESGGVMRFTELQGRNHQTANGLTVTFDNGIMEPLVSAHSYSTAYDRQSVIAAAGGLTVRVPADVSHAFHFPITGPGRVTKTGPGELILAEAWAWAGNATSITADVAGDWTGGTLIESGILSVSNGTVRADMDIEIAATAALNLSDSAVTLGTVTGSGIVSNGTLAAEYRCRVTPDGNDTLTFSDVTLSVPFVVAFEGQPLANNQTLAIATVSGTTAQNLNLATWKGHNAGPMMNAVFRRSGDTVYADIRYTGATLMLLK